jgi:hypothetical protein
MIDWLISLAEVDDWPEWLAAELPDPLDPPDPTDPLFAKPPAALAAGAATGAWAAPASAAEDELAALPEQPASPPPQMMVPAMVPAMSACARCFSKKRSMSRGRRDARAPLTALDDSMVTIAGRTSAPSAKPACPRPRRT